MNRSSKLAGAICAVLLLWLNQPALAADQADQAYALPETSVSANRWEQDLDKLPRNVTIITRQRIEEQNPMSVVELLKGVPGLYVMQSDTYGTYAEISMRGMGYPASAKTLVTVDGRRQNLIDGNGVDFSTIPVDNIERIEVLHGPAGVLYGDSAVGGVINIITRKGSGPAGGTVSAQYGSYDMYGFKGNFKGATEYMDWFVAARYDDADGYRDENHTRIKGANFKTDFYPNQTWSFLVDGVINQANFGVPGSLTKAQMDRDRRMASYAGAYYENKNQAIRGQVKGDFQRCGLVTMDLAFRKWQSEAEVWSHGDNDSKIYDIQPKYVLDSTVGGFANRLTAGVDYSHWDMDYDSFDLTSKAWQYSHAFKMDSLAGYALDEFSLTKNLILNVGARYQDQKYDLASRLVGGTGPTDTPGDEQWAWTAGMVYNFAPGSKVFGRAARAFRFPRVDEYTSYYSGVHWDLKPETAMNYELGVEWQFMPGARLTLTGYIINMNDEIVWNDVTYRNENLDETKHQGVEAAVHVPVCQWAYVFGNLTYQDATMANGPYDGNKIPLAPEWMAAAGVGLEPISGLNVLLRWNYYGQRYLGNDYANAFDKMDAYNTIDAAVSYRWQRYKVFVNASNIFGEDYSTLGYCNAWSGESTYYPMPEAQVWGGVSIDF